MTCLSCEERSKLLAKAREALHRGDHAAATAIVNEIFGTAFKDIKNLGAMAFTKVKGVNFTVREIEVIDPNDKRPKD